MKSILGVALLIGMATARPDDSYLTFKESPEIDTEEVGQSLGVKRTNCTCGTTNRDSGRIVGGTEALPNQYPFMVGIGYLDVKTMTMPDVFCGAALVTVYHAITAAHCTHMQPADQPLGLTVGEHNTKSKVKPSYQRVYQIDRTIEHEAWNDMTVENDIAIVVTRQEMVFDKRHVVPVCLPNSRLNIVGQHIKVAGWGATKFQGNNSPVLLKVTLKVIDMKFCKEKYGITNSSPKQLCTYSYNKDSCQRDSGGPVFYADPESNRYTLVGVVSYGKGCASDFPGVNTDVYSYMDWIQRTVQNSSPKKLATCAKIG